MTVIEEFENELIKNGLTTENLAGYEKLLKRVRGNDMRLEHCCITALRFPLNRSEDALSLIKWGLEKYPPDSWFAAYRVYYTEGMICERCGRYQSAYEAYSKAYNALSDEQAAYRRATAGDLLWMRLHIDGFGYSEELERYYDLFRETDDIQKSFINNEFRLCVARIVIFRHKEMTEEARRSYEKALMLCGPDAVSRMKDILDKHGAEDVLTVTPECSAFLKSVNAWNLEL
ncbi:MAG: hypothetical protein K6G90_03455 [Clostridia bacterium]|nr:hypothetical protein [Clostridia bacterium]